MKILQWVIISLCLFLQQDKTKLNGTYTVIFDKGHQGYKITFSDSIYAKKMPDASIYKGKIDYGKYKVSLKKDKEEDPIEIDNREIGKDTIKFSTKSKRDLSMTINRGMMIKIKSN